MRRKLPILIIALLLVVHTFFGVTVPQVSAATDRENAGQMPVVENGSEATEATEATETSDALDAAYIPDSSDSTEGSNPTENPASADLVADPEQPEETESSDPADSDEVQVTNENDEQPARNVNILTKLTFTGADGAIIDSVQNPGHRIQADEAIQLKYDWALPNNTYKSGDTFTFNLPEQFVIYTDIDEPLATEGGENEVGRFTVDRQGKVVLTFNEYVENHSNVTGTLQIQTELSTEIVKGSTDVTIVTPIKGGEQTVVIQIAPQTAPALEKRGKVDASDSNSITWTLDVNQELDSFSRVLITDPTPEGLQLQKDSIRVYHLQVNGDGSTVLREQLDASEYIVETLEGDKVFKLRWNKESINSAYRIEYSTQMMDQSAQYTNTAILSGEDIEETSASATVTVKRGALLSKSVAKYDPISQTISWTVGYNLGNVHIPQASAQLNDRFNESQQLIPESFKVYKGMSNEVVDASAYTLTMIQNENKTGGFNLQFREDVETAYTLKYQTKSISRVYENEKIVNKITTDGGSSQAEQVLRSGLIKKEVAEANYKDKTVIWKVTLNSDKYPMEHVVIKDSFPNGGLALLPDTVKVASLDGKNKLQSPQDYTVIPGSEGNRSGFELRFDPSKSLNNTYVITYKTSYNTDWKVNKTKPEFWNKVNMEWMQNNEPRSAETDARFWPDNLTKDNGAKRGTYNAGNKEITWDILMNYNKKSWSQTEVRDELQQGQKLIPESVKVYDMTLSGTWNGASKGAEVPVDRYTVIAPSQENGNELRIQFADNVSTPYWITFRTSLEGELLTSQVKNKAVVQSSGTTVAEWTATVAIPHGGVYVTKNGAQNGNKINWKLNINEGQSYVSDARIIDEPSANQILMDDSFHLYSTKVTAGGDISKDQELIRDRDYTLNIYKDEEGKQRFELKFVQAISSAYILEYQSFIHAADKSKVSNKVRMEGNRLTTEKRENEQQITVRTSSGSGTGSGVTGSLEVTKVDKEQPDKILEGATFALYDKAEKRTPIIQTTDANGKIVFSNLLYDDYVLEELTAPEGYDIDQARISVKIDSGVKKTGNMKPIVVTNTKKTEPPVEPGTPADPDPQTPTEPGTPVDPDPQTPTEPGTPADPDPQTPIEPVVPGTPVPVAPVPVIIEDDDIPLGGVDPNPTPSDEGTPGREQPVIPGTPAQPTQPPVVINDDPVPQGIPVGEPQPQQPDDGEMQIGMLPQTGENSKMPFYVSGIILLLLGSSLLFRRKV